MPAVFVLVLSRSRLVRIGRFEARNLERRSVIQVRYSVEGGNAMWKSVDKPASCLSQCDRKEQQRKPSHAIDSPSDLP